jgi:fido (protein-threonine AMPylation protein)
MHPTDCPAWEYSGHPKSETVVLLRVSEILACLVKRQLDTMQVATDTREVHRRIFKELTPVGYEYFAGHYRGELFRCLRFYPVMVPNDPRVGVPAISVGFMMDKINDETRSGMMALDSHVGLNPKDRLRYIIALASRVFVAFLTVHPYANGNGHAGRFIVWCILCRYGHWPRRWPVDPRPPDPPYSSLIVECRNGNPEPLEQYLLKSLVG